MNVLSRLVFTVVLVVAVACSAAGCTNDAGRSEAAASESTSSVLAYDSLLAAELGADEYGMRRYVMALLKAGPNRDQDSTRAAQLQRAHLDNIRRLAEEGTLILAGPFLDEGSLQGIYVFNVSTVEEARKLTETDPAVQAGRLVMDLHPWYGSAALQEVNTIHGRITKP